MGETTSISATQFKATCLDLLDQLAAHKITRLEITKRGKVVAVITPPEPPKNPFDELYGMMKGCVIAPPDFDFTAPVFDGVMHAAEGRLVSDDEPDHDADELPRRPDK